jgi:hypothetical protein
LSSSTLGSPLPPYLDQLASLKALYEAKGQAAAAAAAAGLPLPSAAAGLPLAPAHLLGGGGLLPPGLGFPPRPPAGLPPHFLGLPGHHQPPNMPPREYPLHPWFINRHRFPLGKH